MSLGTDIIGASLFTNVVLVIQILNEWNKRNLIHPQRPSDLGLSRRVGNKGGESFQERAREPRDATLKVATFGPVIWYFKVVAFIVKT